MFKSLVISYNIPPYHINSAIRIYNYLRNFNKYNWDVTLVTSLPVGIDTNDYLNNSELKLSNFINIPSIHKDLLKLPDYKIKLSRFVNAFFTVPDKQKRWSKKAAFEADKLLQTENYDVLFLTLPPFSILKEFVYLKKKYDIPIIVDYRELWLDNYNAIYPTFMHRTMHKKAEYNSLKQVDKIIVPNRKIKEHLLYQYPFLTFDDIVILHNSFYEKDFIYNVPQKSDKLIILHPGSLLQNFDLMPFFKAFSELKLRNKDFANNVEIKFVKPLKQDVKKKIFNLNILDNIKELDINSLSELNQEITNSDVILVNLPSKNQNIDLLTPPIIYQVFGAKKPIFAIIPDGALEQDLRKYDASYISNPNDNITIQQQLLDLYNDYRNRRLPKPNFDFVSQHNSAAITEELTKIFQFYLPAY